MIYKIDLPEIGERITVEEFTSYYNELYNAEIHVETANKHLCNGMNFPYSFEGSLYSSGTERSQKFLDFIKNKKISAKIEGLLVD